MSPEAIVTIVGGVFAASGVAYIIIRRLPKKVKATNYRRRWRELQRQCGNKQQWPEVIIGADKLLDEVLKKKRKSGKSMGERMVSAQRDFSNNDAIWKAHKLANYLAQSEEEPNLKEKDVKESLVAFREALRDLGAV